jgi:hypothetical protein
MLCRLGGCNQDDNDHVPAINVLLRIEENGGCVSSCSPFGICRDLTPDVEISLQIRVRPQQGGHRHHEQDHSGLEVRRCPRPRSYHRGPCAAGLLQLRMGRDGVELMKTVQ